MIRALIIEEADVYNHSNSTNSDSNDSDVDNKNNHSSVSENPGDISYDDVDFATDEYFNNLYNGRNALSQPV